MIKTLITYGSEGELILQRYSKELEQHISQIIMCEPVLTEEVWRVPFVHNLNMEVEGENLGYGNITIMKKDLSNETLLSSMLRDIEPSEVTLGKLFII